MLRTFWAVLLRDVLLARRRRAEVLTPLFFFVMTTALFPLGIGPEAGLLRAIAPGILWVTALLASLLSLGRLFEQDWADGTLEQMLLSPEPLALIVAAKVLAHWLMSGLPLVLLSPVLALQFGLPPDAIGALAMSLLLGTPVLSLLGAIGAALTLGLRGAGVLVALLVLPLCMPVLIFGAGAVGSWVGPQGPAANLSLLGGLLAGALALCPWGAAAALRLATE
jgi:heme exporter protein B